MGLNIVIGNEIQASMVMRRKRVMTLIIAESNEAVFFYDNEMTWTTPKDGSWLPEEPTT